MSLSAPCTTRSQIAEDRLPKFGTVDYLVENGLAPISDASLVDCVGTSPLTSPTGGRVDVLPAFGQQALQHPTNTLANISRAVLEDIDSEGESISVSAQVNAMIDRLTQRESYDVVLIDTRAGLAEIPDIFRVEAGILRKGGVAVPRKK